MATIYFNSKKPEQNVNDFLKAVEIPAHEKIGLLFTRIRETDLSNEQDRTALLLNHLRVDMDDADAVKTMSSLVHHLSDGSLKIVPSENAGIFFIKKPSVAKDQFEDVAVFKIGRKRAAMETLARQFGHRLGLGKQVVPGIFCAVSNLTFTCSEEDETVEELWNGNQKIFLPPQERESIKTSDEFNESESLEYSEECSAERTAAVVVGIVQPFLKKEPVASLYDYAQMTILALAIGLRDGKTSSYEGSTFLDVEDCMPVRIDPIWNLEKIEKAPSAIDLPYLDKDPRTDQQISEEDVKKLANLVQQWNITKIVNGLKGLTIRYEDTEAELFSLDKTGLDEGEHRVRVEKGRLHLINGYLNHLDPSNLKRRVLLPEQLDACNTRLQRIRDFITFSARRNETFTSQQLVHAVDLYGKIFQDVILCSELPLRYEKTLTRSGVNTISGRTSPKALKVSMPSLDKVPSNTEINDELEKLAKDQQDEKKS